jgi:hypothetical protein
MVAVLKKGFFNPIDIWANLLMVFFRNLWVLKLPHYGSYAKNLQGGVTVSSWRAKHASRLL